MSTLKSFQEVVVFLQANKDKKVSAILEEVLLMTISKKVQDVTRINEAGNLEIYCWYHKEWEDTTLIEYGKKASTDTGLNTFCKQGVNAWTKQQSDSKKSKVELLENVAEGKVKPTDINKRLAEIELERMKIVSYKEEEVEEETEENDD